MSFVTEKWAIPVGVILGLLAIGATVGSVLVFRRRNGGWIFFIYANEMAIEENYSYLQTFYFFNAGLFNY